MIVVVAVMESSGFMNANGFMCSTISGEKVLYILKAKMCEVITMRTQGQTGVGLHSSSDMAHMM